MSDEFIAKRIIEGIMFLSKDPLTIKDLSALTGFKPALVSYCLKELVDDYDTRGIRIKAVAGAYSMFTAPEIAPYIENLRRYTSGISLSRAALETLAIVAYRQPVTRAQVEEIRGVNSDGILNKLLEMKLVRVEGRAEGAGRPILFGTTKTFLETFGIDSIKDLPHPDSIVSEAQEQ